jgi:hypothetical protein
MGFHGVKKTETKLVCTWFSCGTLIVNVPKSKFGLANMHNISCSSKGPIKKYDYL